MTAPQHMQALELAGKARSLQCAELRKARKSSVVPLLTDRRRELQSLRIGRVLLAQPRWGRTQVIRVLRQLQISEERQLRQLTSRQRRALIETLSKEARG